MARAAGDAAGVACAIAGTASLASLLIAALVGVAADSGRLGSGAAAAAAGSVFAPPPGLFQPVHAVVVVSRGVSQNDLALSGAVAAVVFAAVVFAVVAAGAAGFAAGAALAGSCFGVSQKDDLCSCEKTGTVTARRKIPASERVRCMGRSRHRPPTIHGVGPLLTTEVDKSTPDLGLQTPACN